MSHEMPVQINITINIIAGNNVTNSAIIQGGDQNNVTISSGNIPPDVLGFLRELIMGANRQ